jgi:hypothetical protein
VLIIEPHRWGPRPSPGSLDNPCNAACTTPASGGPASVSARGGEASQKGLGEGGSLEDLGLGPRPSDVLLLAPAGRTQEPCSVGQGLEHRVPSLKP